jgi:hypothetical protein
MSKKIKIETRRDLNAVLDLMLSKTITQLRDIDQARSSLHLRKSEDVCVHVAAHCERVRDNVEDMLKWLSVIKRLPRKLT